MLRLLLVLALFLPTVASAQFRARVQSQTPATAPSTLMSRVADVDDLHHSGVITRGVSGSDLSGGIDLRAPDGGWVYGIEMAESSDRPCHVSLMWATIDNGQLSTAESEHSPCGETTSSRKFTAVAVSQPSAQVPNGHLGAITGLKVCQRNSNDRVKGVHIVGKWLDPVGASMQTSGTAWRWANGPLFFDRPNCNDWEHDFEMCPAGKVVVGVRIEQAEPASSGANVIKGLAPICARIDVER